MRFPIFASFLMFCAWFAYVLHKRKKQESKAYEDFWAEEHKANNTRRKSLEDIDLISVPLDQLPFDILNEDEQIQDYHRTIQLLSEEPVANFTGITNTELKLRYGAPNLEILSLYDQRYTSLVRTLQDWAQYLHGKNFSHEALKILNYAIEINTDIYASYELYLSLCNELNIPYDSDYLKNKAQTINSSSKNRILKLLTSLETE